LAGLTIRLATFDDLPILRALMERAIAGHLPAVLTPEQVEASREHMGLDTQLIEDGGYFLVEIDGAPAGCGGSRHATLYGGDHSAGRDAALLDPAKDPARIRAMYTDPAYARRGVGRLILEAGEAAARAEGFTRLELAATLSGAPLYRAYGFETIEETSAPGANGARVPLIRMGKAIA
jgi:GNAT superfamily N-acetyltransferase